jgi:hypothetical protein
MTKQQSTKEQGNGSGTTARIPKKDDESNVAALKSQGSNTLPPPPPPKPKPQKDET